MDGLDGALTGSEDRGDRSGVEFLEVPQGDHLCLAVVEMSERYKDLIALQRTFYRSIRFDLGGCHGFVEVKSAAAAISPHQVDELVAGDAEEPGGEGRALEAVPGIASSTLSMTSEAKSSEV